MNDKLKEATAALLASYTSGSVKIHHLDRRPLPAHAEIIRVLGALHELLFPGYAGAQGLTGTALSLHVESRMAWLYETLTEQISRAINHGKRIEDACDVTEQAAADCAAAFLTRLPDLRATLATDVQAAYDGDPAAGCFDEIIFSYPGLYAVMTYRLAHELHRLRVPLIPRIMTEYAHHRTGIDIHPGTQIGPRFFIDHGTGVVIGGTAVIGANVKLYQGVTLGAFSFDKDSSGALIRNTKRHPTIEDDVVIYAGATILGGETVIGRGSVIGGNVWLTHSVPPGTHVRQESPNLRIITPDQMGPAKIERSEPPAPPAPIPPGLTYEGMSELGRDLVDLSRAYEVNGGALLTEDEIELELARRRGGFAHEDAPGTDADAEPTELRRVRTRR